MAADAVPSDQKLKNVSELDPSSPAKTTKPTERGSFGSASGLGLSEADGTT